MKVALIVVKLLFLAAFIIISNNNLYMTDAVDREVFFDKYTGWIGNLFSHGAEVTGFVVKFEWLPINRTAVNNTFGT